MPEPTFHLGPQTSNPRRHRGQSHHVCRATHKAGQACRCQHCPRSWSIDPHFLSAHIRFEEQPCRGGPPWHFVTGPVQGPFKCAHCPFEVDHLPEAATPLGIPYPADGRAVDPPAMAQRLKTHLAAPRWGKTAAARIARGKCPRCIFDGQGAPCGAGFLNERGQGLQCSNCGHQEPCHPEDEAARARSEPDDLVAVSP